MTKPRTSHLAAENERLQVRIQSLEARLDAAHDAYVQLAREALAQRREFGFTATAPDRPLPVLQAPLWGPMVDLAIEELAGNDPSLRRILTNQARGCVAGKMEDDQIVKELRNEGGA